MSRWMIWIKKRLSISNNNDLVAVLFPTSNFLILLFPIDHLSLGLSCLSSTGIQ